MEKCNELFKLLQYLQREDIRFTNDFVSDIKKLVQTDVESFAIQFFKDFARKNFEKYNRFKKLKLDKHQKAEIDCNILWRYEYRNNSNFRCIFIIKKENNNDIPILICAFHEDGDKGKGEKSYDHNIRRAINIIKKNSS